MLGLERIRPNGLRKRVEALEDELKEMIEFRKALGGIASLQVLTEAHIHVFKGGRLPARQTDGAIGFDAYARAIIDESSKPTETKPLRDTRADFIKNDGWINRLDSRLFGWVDENDPQDSGKYVISLPPGERVMVGLGFATRMDFPMFYWVAPRSGLASRGITIANSPGTVDPDYRGEAGALLENNSKNNFDISHDMRIAQIIFGFALIPRLHSVKTHQDLGGTRRGAGGFGSSGEHKKDEKPDLQD